MPLIQSLAVSLLACAVHCLAPAALADSSQPGPFAVSQRTVTITRASGTTFTAQIRYPASSAAANAPFATAAAPAPAITFGHGFLSAVDLYDSTMDHLASHGYIVIATTSIFNIIVVITIDIISSITTSNIMFTAQINKIIIISN